MKLAESTKHAVFHAAPFVAWIAMMSALPATAAGYAARTAVTAVVGLWCWRKYGWALPADAKRARSWAAGLAVGVVVAVLWIAPEDCAWYRRWLTWGGETASGPSPYDPAACGWALTLAKLVGSAFVIAPVEEVFFRSFLYRRLQRVDFRAVAAAAFDLSAFLWMVGLFALEHPPRFVAGAMAGAFYGFAFVRFGLAAAIVAHVVTNLLLALWVVLVGDWGFW